MKQEVSQCVELMTKRAGPKSPPFHGEFSRRLTAYFRLRRIFNAVNPQGYSSS